MSFNSQLIQLQTPPGAERRWPAESAKRSVATGLKQTTLAFRSGVTLASLRRFEQTGDISLKHLMRICHALGRLDEFDSLLRPPPAATMAELEARVSRPKRKRGSR